MARKEAYQELFRTLDALCENETDPVTLMATIVCELYHKVAYVDWAGFYRNIGNQTLKIGPYQGGHGCTTIPYTQGVCGKSAREKKLQNIADVSSVPHHIACSVTTRSEIVIPILSAGNELLYVLDLDSDTEAAFDSTDEICLPCLNKYFL